MLSTKLNDAVAVSNDLAHVLGMNTKNPGEILGKLKVVANDTKSTFSSLSGAIESKNINEVIKQTDKIANKLENTDVSGKEMKSILLSVGKLISSIAKVALDATSGNFVSLPVDVAKAILDLKDAMEALKYGFQKFMKFYNEKIKPELHNLKIKLVDPIENKVKKMFKKKDVADKDKEVDHHKIKDFFKKMSNDFDHVFHKSKSKSKDAKDDVDHKAIDVEAHNSSTILPKVEHAELVQFFHDDSYTMNMIEAI